MPMPLSEWLDRHLIQLLVQDVPRGRRAKNRVLLEYRDDAAMRQAVGARTVIGAIAKACLRMKVTGKAA